MPRITKKPKYISTGSMALNTLIAGGAPAGSLQTVYANASAPVVTGISRAIGVKGASKSIGAYGSIGHIGIRGPAGITIDQIKAFETVFSKRKYRLLEDFSLKMRAQDPGGYTTPESYSYMGDKCIPAGTAVTGAELTKFIKKELSKLHPSFYKWDKNYPVTRALVYTSNNTIAHLNTEIFEDYGYKPKPKNLFIISERLPHTFMIAGDAYALQVIGLELVLQLPPEKICSLITVPSVKESHILLDLMKAILAGHTTPL
jgi:hypothetical protein